MKCNKETLTVFVWVVAEDDGSLGFSVSFSWMNMNTDSLTINHKRKQNVSNGSSVLYKMPKIIYINLRLSNTTLSICENGV